MIKVFADTGTEDIFRGRVTKAARRVLPLELHAIARRKLAVIDYSSDVGMLRIPPSNHLEALDGDRKGQYSIRINRRYRICFRWDEEEYATAVEIVDYH
ncbi:MAG TPA: type II toxin-antitoxin system RelE/ParE family toxin [Candidatus Dormibacteraeota bacterium]|nr:type II toxin-antitoxin system RelE/ParE family toxin [Candidatus Dormibacteraeota bacterium]